MKKGVDVRISSKAEITRPELIVIGNHVSIDMGVYISVTAKLGDYIHIAPHVCIIGGAKAELIMEDFTNIGAGGKIVCATDDFTKGMINPIVPIKYRNVIYKSIIFKKFSTLGVNCTILPGVTLGEGSIVGANSLVLKNTEPWTIYAGSPAKPIRLREKKLILQAAKELGYEY